jgi:hypothetical protein
MVHLVTFTSSQFDVAAETPNPINPIAGEGVLNWLREKLRSAGYDVTAPGLGSNMIFVAKIRTTVCHSCGHVRIFASEEARKKLKTSKRWKSVGA